MKKQIIVDIDADGAITVEGKGFKGASCTLATKAFEDALGKVTKRTNTSDFYQKEETVRIKQ